MNNRRIIIATNLPVWSMDKNSGGRALYSTIMGYINSKWDVTLITTGGNVPEEFGNITLIEKKVPDFKFSFLQSRIAHWINKTINQNISSRFYYNTCSKILKNNFQDTVLYAYEVGAVSAFKKLAIKYNVPFVERFQGTIIKPKECKHLIYRLRKRTLISALRTEADLVIMTNDGTQGLDVLRKIGNQSKHIEFLRNGVTMVDNTTLMKKYVYREKYDINQNEFVFITISRLEYWKRVDRAIEAFKELYRKKKNIRLLIIGEGSDKRRLECLVDTYNLKEVIKFCGRIEQNIVFEYLILSDMFLSFYDLSNLGNPLFEAMMCGKPIITLDVGDTKTVINNNENGILISTENMDIISSKMQLLMDDNEFRLKISQNARKFALDKFYTWDKRMEHEISIVKYLSKRI